MIHSTRRLILALSLLVLPFMAAATHIVGGTLTYVHNGGSSYTFTMKLYRDCGPGNAAFPASPEIFVRTMDGHSVTSFFMAGGTPTLLPSNLDSCAVAPSPMPCVEERIYTATVNTLHPIAGGYHLYYQVCCRNLSTTNVDASCNCIGATIAASIPGPSAFWHEDFTLANGTTSDAGTTAWSITNGATAPASASVNGNAFRVTGANNGIVTWTSQVINVAALTSGFNLSMSLWETGALDNNDDIDIEYSVNGGAFVNFANNGALSNDFNDGVVASSGLLTANTVQIRVVVDYDGSSPTSETYFWDNVIVSAGPPVSNANPTFNIFPPLFLCNGNTFNFNHAATDPDGDSLVYSFYTPYTDATPTITGTTASYSPVIWEPGYGTTNPLGGPALTLNSSTGMLSGTPTQNGQFVVGVRVSEYRNGVLLSEMTRDFQFNVVTCPAPAQALINPAGVINACSGLSVSFPNNSDAAATNFWWNFGDGSTIADTSVQQFPTYAYPTPGTYTATLIINKGTPCADTATATVFVGFVTASFTHNAPQCPGTNVTFTNTTSMSSNATITGWAWDFGDGGTSTAQHPTHAYAAGGTYNVQLVASTNLGCSDTSIVSITIHPIPAVTASNDGPHCEGSTLNLSAGNFAGATYSWTGPNGFTSNSQNPVINNATPAASGVYTVTPTANGCVGTPANTTVVIHPTPAAPVASNNSPMCVGNTINFTATAGAGATFNWTGPNGFSSTSANPSIATSTMADAGVYSVTATINGCISPAATTTVTLTNAPAAPVAGSNSPVCEGGNINLTASAIAGATYSWTGPNGFTSSVQNPVISGATAAMAGTYSVTATVGGCQGPAGTTSVTINPQPASPVASSNSPLCTGGAINLQASTVTGATYSWTGPNGFTSTAQNPVIANSTTANAGVYSVTITVAGCPSVPATTTVVINQTPATPTASNDGPHCAGATLNLSTPAVVGASYSWTGPGSFSSTQQNPVINGTTTANSGVYSVTITVGGCTSAAGTTTATITAIPTSPTAGSNSPICAGSTLNLTASSITGATYNWTGPNGFSSTVQNPSITSATTAASGTYQVTATVNGCTGSAGSVLATVNPVPAVPVVSSNSPVCVGNTINLQGPTVSGATYSWTGPNGFSSALEDPAISSATLAAGGTYNLTVTVNGCTSGAGSTAVVVNPIPATPTATNSGPVCEGGNVTLSTPAVVGATYAWAGPTGFTSTLQNPVINGVTAAMAGNYSVVITVNGCPSAPGTTNLVINPIPATPTASSNTPVCTGTTLTLFASTISGATYSWTGPNSFSSTLQNPTITNAGVAAAGTYSVTATVSGCPSSTATTNVTINPTPATPTASSNSPICEGSTLNLSTPAVASATYSWVGPNGFSSPLQNPSIAGAGTAATGNYQVTITVGGCTSLAGSTSVVVNPIPSAPVPSSNSPICAGATLNLTTPAVTGATYSWTGPNSFSSSLQNPTITSATTAASGSYALTITVNGCTSAAGNTIVTVNPIPAAPTASSNSPVCSGTTLNLNASAVSGASYSWTGPNSFTSTLQNPAIGSVTTAASGIYTVIATVNGCASPSATTTVTVNPTPATPVANSSFPVCEGGTLNLTTAAVTGATYNWTGPDGFSSTLQNPTISGITTDGTGTYSVTVTVNGCTSLPGGTAVVVNNIPPAPTPSSNTPVCTGNAITLFASSVPGATYSWTGPGGFTSTAQNPVRAASTVAMSGTYTVTSVVNGCNSTAANHIVTVNPTPATPTASSNSPVCEGAPLNLSTPAVVGATYNWNGPAGFSSTSQNPVIASAPVNGSGAYTVTVTVNGCTSLAGTTNVVVNPIPATPVAGSNTHLCTGDTLFLTSNTVAGATYSWTGPGGYSSALQNPIRTPVTFAMDGTYSVTVMVNGCTSAPGTTTPHVHATPATPVASSNSPVCSGDSLLLSANSITNATYSWTGPNSFSATVQDPFIFPASTSDAGTYNVIAEVDGCPSAPGSVAVIINQTPAAPVATSNSPVCVGNNINLSAVAVTGATYSWIGPGSFTSTLQNPVVTSATLADGGDYILTVTVNGCTSPADTVNVAVNSAPPAPVISSNTPVCTGDTIIFTASTVAGATYSWTGPNGFTSSLQNPTITSAATNNAGTYTLVVDNGCASVPVTTNVTINATPATPTTNGNSPLCVGSTLNLTSASVSGATFSWSGPASFSSTLQNPSISSIALNQAGTYSVIATANGCPSAPGTVAVVVHDTTTVNAGPDQIVCANDADVLLAGTLSGGSTTGIWSSNGTGLFLPNDSTLNATYQPTAADTAAGIVILTLTSTNNGACPAGTDQMTVTITDAPVAFAGADQSVCANSPIVNLNGSVAVATGGIWSTSGSGTFAPSNTALNGTYTPSPADTLSGSVNLTLITTGNGDCLADTDLVVITITPSPVVNAGVDQVICLSSPAATLSGSVSGATTTGIWTTLGTGAFSPSASALNATYNPGSADTVAGTVTLVLTSSNNGGCIAVTDTMVITYQNQPIVDAGLSDTVCANNSLITLNGSIGGGATSGYWSTSGTGTFSPDSSVLNGTYMPSFADTAAGSVILTLQSSNGCVQITDQITITITPGPQVASGPDQVVCSNNNLVTLNGSVTGATTTGHWTTTGTGTFSPSPNVLNPTYTPSTSDLSGAVNLILTSTNNGTCLAEVDSVLVTFIDPAIVAAGADETFCANDSLQLAGQITAGFGTGVWTSSGTGSFIPSATALNAIYAPSAADTTAGSVTLILTSTNNGNCLASSDTMVATITPAPVVDAGSDFTVCSDVTPVNINGSVTVATGGLWSTSGTGTFGSATSLSTTYAPSSADIGLGSISLILTSTGNNLCNPVTDTMVLSFTDVPVVSAGPDTFICTGSTTAQINGSVSGGTSTGTWTTLGTGSFSPSANSLSATYTLSTADTTAGFVTLVLTSTGNGVCAAQTDTMVIYVTPIPSVGAGADTTVCASSPSVTLNGVSFGGPGTFVWATTGDGTFTPSATQLNATYDPGPGDIAGGSVHVYLTPTNSCLPIPDSLLITITPDPVVNAGVDLDVCFGTSFQLSGTVSSSAQGGKWTTNGGGSFLPHDSALNVQYVPDPNDTLVTGLYVVLTSTGNGACNAATDTALLNILPMPVAMFSDTVVCQNASFNLYDQSSVSAGTIDQWTWFIGSDTLTTQDINYSFSGSGYQTVVLIVSTTGGCSDTIVDSIFVNPTPVAQFSYATSCSSDSVIFTDESSVSSGTINSWTWDLGDGNNSTLQHPEHLYANPGTYVVSITVASDSGCTGTYTDTVIVNERPQADFTASGDCSGEQVFINQSLSGSGAIVSVNWNFGDGNTASGDSVVHNYGASGDYTVTLVIETTTGCRDSASMVVTISPQIVASFTPAGGTFYTGNEIQFNSTTPGATFWNWEFGTGDGATVESPKYAFDQTGTYTVTLIAGTQPNCADTISYEFIIGGGVPAVPSAFTPNGDGLNDVLLLRGGPFSEIDFRVFNEWGQEVFRSIDPNVGWDGTVDGKLQPASTFVYTVRGLTANGEEVRLSGDVTILR